MRWSFRRRADPKLGETVVVLLTSVGQTRETAALREAGIFACLTKPVRQSQLLNTLAAAWSSRNQKLSTPPKPERRLNPASAPVSLFKDYSPRVLVVEDNIINQRIAARLLQNLGCTVDVVANGREAVEMIGSIPYDLVLMDVQMPEMDGFAATAEVRRGHGPQTSLPIVAMTANAMAGDRERCLEAGMNDYVSKPVHPEDLQRVLYQWVKVPAHA